MRSPPRLAARTATKPGPPSESGSTSTSSSGAASDQPAAIAAAASTADKVPPKESGPTTTRVTRSSRAGRNVRVQVTVRPMTTDDIETCREVQTRAFQAHDRAHGEPTSDPDDTAMARQRGRFHHFLAHDPAGSWVATVDDVVVGAALALRREGLWGLSLLVVDPERQGTAAGRALLQASLRHAEGATAGIILSSQDPRAIRSYAVAGFDLFPQ